MQCIDDVKHTTEGLITLFNRVLFPPETGMYLAHSREFQNYMFPISVDGFVVQLTGLHGFYKKPADNETIGQDVRCPGHVSFYVNENVTRAPEVST